MEKQASKRLGVLLLIADLNRASLHRLLATEFHEAHLWAFR